MLAGQEDASHEMKASPDFVENSLYLKEKFSDVILLVGGERLPAHKAVLGGKSKRFETLFDENADTKELTISNTSPASFRILLKYIYTDVITIPSGTELMLEVLILAHQHSFKHLTSSIIKQVKTILDKNNIIFFVNGANDHGLDDLRNACHSFIDANAMEILSSESFNNLTRKSVLQILNRETFWAPEIDIFGSVAKWCEKNNDNIVVNCVRLSLLSLSDIVSIVQPTKLVSSEKLLETISEIVGTSTEKESFLGGVLAVDTNVASAQCRAMVISPGDSADLLTGNRSVAKYVSHVIGGEDGIVIHLNKPYFINHVRMKLYDADKCCYSYYIETSLNKKQWHRVVDYRTYTCRSLQSLYFGQQVCRYIKVVGTRNTWERDFRLVFFEAFYKSEMPRIKNGISCPVTNVATLGNGAVVSGGTRPQCLLDGNHGTCSSHLTSDLNGIIVELPQPYIISRMGLLLGKDHRMKYFVETSVIKTDWVIAIDRRTEESTSWQDLHFPERIVVYIKIVGTSAMTSPYSCSPNANFYHLECPPEHKK